MPIYEYMCTNSSCEHELEAMQKIADDRLVFCPSCGEASLKKKISAASFRLKGTGWYETDFKNNGNKEATKSGDAKAEAKPAKSSDSAKPDTKSDPKSDTKSSSKSSSKSGGGTTEAA